MIRQEYEKIKSQKNKSPKEIEGIKKMGERAYYSMEIKKLSGLIKGIGFNTIFTFFIGIGLSILIILGIIANKAFLKDGYVIAGLCVTSAINLWAIAWVLFVKRRMKKKMQRYKGIIKNMNDAEMDKKKAIYNVYKKEA